MPEAVEIPGADELLAGFTPSSDAAGDLENLEIEDFDLEETDSEPPPPRAYGRENANAFIVTGASIYEGQSMPTALEAEELEEDWELKIGTLDLSSLLGYMDEAGQEAKPEIAFEGLEDEREEASSLEEYSTFSDAGEIPMLSDSEREMIEELALAEDDSSSAPPEDAICLGDFIEPYIPFFARGPESMVASMRLAPDEALLLEVELEDAANVVQDAEGLYSIAASHSPGMAPEDPELRSLVDSVLGVVPR
jgi:hypothetical protein